MTNKIICPECQATLEHQRGYLPTHTRGIQRGQLVTGSQVCDLSNTKVVTECKKIEYAAVCPNCGTDCSVALTEDYPGAFGDQPREAFLTVDCIGCSRDHDGYYCTDPECGLEVEERASVFWRVSDDVNTYLPKFVDPTSTDATKRRPRYRDFDTEAEASAFIGTLPGYETGRYNLDEMRPGWYSVGDGSGLHHGTVECVGASKDIKRLAIGDDQHRPQFQVAARHPVQLYDQSAVFQEEPEPGDTVVQQSEQTDEVAVLVCSCCNLARPDLPFHHDAHDDSGRSWDYCQECEDAGCDLIDCNVRAAQRAATTTR